MTAGKMLTGQDVPLSNMEMTLTSTFHQARERFKQQQEKAGRSGHKRR